MLQQRYTTQASQFVVSNQGCGGEEASGPGVSGNPGYLRLPAVLDAESPQALLLLEGANDLVNGDQPTLLPALTTMVQTARSRRIVVFIGTLLPQRANGSPARSSPQSVALVVPTNDQIKSMALTQGAILVDLYQAFGGSPDPYIDVDGLHPTNEGHKVIAQTFFDAVRKNLEAGP